MLYTPKKVEVIKEDEYLQCIIEVEETLSAHAKEGTFKSFDGLNIFYRNYLVENPVGSIVIVHGFTEYCKKYTELAWYFINNGYNVFTYDHRGHGLSERQVEGLVLAHVNSFEDYVKDLERFIEDIVVPCAGKENINIFSHSMGGSVTTLYLMRCGDRISRALLSSPMVYPFTSDCPITVLKLMLKQHARKNGWDARFKYASDFNPDHPFDKSHDTSYPRFRHNLDVRLSDERYQTSASTNRWMYEAVTVGKKMLRTKDLKKIKAKVLVISSGEDTVVRPKPQKKLADRLGCGFMKIEGAKHSAFICASEKLEKYVQTVFAFLES